MFARFKWRLIGNESPFIDIRKFALSKCQMMATKGTIMIEHTKNIQHTIVLILFLNCSPWLWIVTRLIADLVHNIRNENNHVVLWLYEASKALRSCRLNVGQGTITLIIKEIRKGMTEINDDSRGREHLKTNKDRSSFRSCSMHHYCFLTLFYLYYLKTSGTCFHTLLRSDLACCPSQSMSFLNPFLGLVLV